MLAWVTVGSAAPGVSTGSGSAGEPSRVSEKVAVASEVALLVEDGATEPPGLALAVWTGELAAVVGDGELDPAVPDTLGDGPRPPRTTRPTTTRTAIAAMRYQARRVIGAQA